MELEKLPVNDKITANKCVSKALYQTLQITKMHFEKLRLTGF